MASALVQAQIIGQQRLRALASHGVASAWAGLPGYDRENVPEFMSKAVPIVRGAQRHSSALTNAYLARALHRRPLGLDVGKLLAGLRGGTPTEDVYHRSFVTVWAALKNGTQWSEAVRMGLERAVGAAATDVQLAQTATLQEIGQRDPRILGYERVADGGACSFCEELDGARFGSDSAMPIHNNCGCSVEAITGGDFASTPPPETVAIHDHGELGPVITAPGDDFTHLH